LSKFLGVDIGTGGCKILLMGESGETLGKNFEAFETINPAHGWWEQSAEEWWQKTVVAVRKIVKQTRVNPEEIKAIGLSGQSPVMVPVDCYGRPLRNAILWMDTRSFAHAEKIRRLTGLKVEASDILPKILWIRENEPKIFENTHKFLQATDFITYKLTGSFVTDYISASASVNQEITEWPNEILRELGISPEKFPEVMTPGSIAGIVPEKTSKELSVGAGALVSVGSIDAYVAMIGSGAVKDGIATDVTGTSTCLMVATERNVFDEMGRVFSQTHIVHGLRSVSGVMSTTGAALRWFKDNFAHAEKTESKKTGKSVYEILDDRARTVSAGSEGLIFLPYLAGERSPIWDPFAKGVFFGVRLSHRKEHFFRAILEGCAFGLRQNIEVIESLGIRLKEIRLGGGGGKSRLWAEIKANVTGKEMILLKEFEVSPFGAAILASFAAASPHKSLADFASGMVRPVATITPDRELFEKYSSAYEVYKKIYENTKSLMSKSF
jgi:xylulokinase